MFSLRQLFFALIGTIIFFLNFCVSNSRPPKEAAKVSDSMEAPVSFRNLAGIPSECFVERTPDTFFFFWFYFASLLAILGFISKLAEICLTFASRAVLASTEILQVFGSGTSARRTCLFSTSSLSILSALCSCVLIAMQTVQDVSPETRERAAAMKHYFRQYYTELFDYLVSRALRYFIVSLFNFFFSVCLRLWILGRTRSVSN